MSWLGSSRAAHAAALLLCVVSCREDQVGSEAFFAETARALETACACFVEAGEYGDVPSCTSDLTTLTPAHESCIADVMNEHAENTRPVVDCWIEAAQDYTACLERSACDMAIAVSCGVEYDRTQDDCPLLDYGIESQIGLACFGEPAEPPFTCADGEQIPESWQCDQVSDCRDGSDEADCPDAPETFACEDDSGFVPLAWVCDGEADCADASDEQNC